MRWRGCAVLPVSAAAAGRAAPAHLGVRAGEARRTSGAQGTMSDAGGGKKPPVEPQAGPGPGRSTGERGLSGSFPLVLKKLMENPPRETRLGEGGGSRVPGGGVSVRAGPCGGGAGRVRSEVRVKRSSGGGGVMRAPVMTRGLLD